MSTNGVVVMPGQEFVWKMEPDRAATFKLLSEQTGDSMSIFEELIPAGFVRRSICIMAAMRQCAF